MIKNCSTCAHQLKGDYDSDVSKEAYAKCLKFQEYCSIAVQFNNCKLEVDWQEKPAPPPPVPRRSLRKWFIDTFWRI